MTVPDALGVVVIGRNEGARLERCLASVNPGVHRTVYVDSGSTDGSVAVAESAGATVVRLDLSRPFTAARARNAGLEALVRQQPGLVFVQFIDGDCELAAGWLETARAFLDSHEQVGVVCGRRRERHPERSVYNRLCDLEWDTPVGETPNAAATSWSASRPSCEVGGFRPDLIAGEEPELCVRLRGKLADPANRRRDDPARRRDHARPPVVDPHRPRRARLRRGVQAPPAFAPRHLEIGSAASRVLGRLLAGDGGNRRPSSSRGASRRGVLPAPDLPDRRPTRCSQAAVLALRLLRPAREIRGVARCRQVLRQCLARAQSGPDRVQVARTRHPPFKPCEASLRGPSYRDSPAPSAQANSSTVLKATSVRFVAFSFFMMLRTCTLTVLSHMLSS